MKKILLVTAFCGILGFAIPATPLHADVGFGGRIDLGFNLLFVPALFQEVNSELDGGLAMLPILPIGDLGFYGQLVAGPFRLGIGARGFSFLFFVNLFWPAIQAEIDLGSRVTFNAKIGGGLFYLFPLWGAALPMVIPEGGVWFRLNKSNRNRMQLGLGGLALLSNPNTNSDAGWLDLNNYKGFVFYFGFKGSFNFDPMKDD
jgi:hypothetical protein